MLTRDLGALDEKSCWRGSGKKGLEEEMLAFPFLTGN